MSRLLAGRCLAVTHLMFFVANASGVPAPAREVDAAGLEEQVVIALLDGKRAKIDAVQRQIGRLDPARRAELGFRINRDTVEFHFAGAYPHGETQPESLEYIVSERGVKDHETLLAVAKDEVRQLRVLRPLFQPQRRPLLADAVLSWQEGGAVQAILLADIMHQEAEQDRAAFIQQLEVNEAGLGGAQNVKGDAMLLPPEAVRARIVLIFRARP